MSAIAGIFYWDGRAVPESDVAVLAAHNQSFGPDGGGTVARRGLAMQAHLLRFDAYSASERQPHTFTRASVLTWDGRLDNRDDLLIVHHHALGADFSDAALVAASYERWGIESLQRFVGDWTLAIWDDAQEQLVLACDYMGNRALHYIETPDGVAWSTSINALAERFDRVDQPDDEYIAGRLAFGVPPGVTPFRGVRKLPGGHRLVVERNRRATLSRYWTFRPTTIRYRQSSDYDDRLRELLTDAVRVRLRADRPVWAHLSGGWDSSSIVCLAHAMIQRGQVPAPCLQPVSIVHSASPESDERPFIQVVERWCGLSTIALDDLDAEVTFEDLLAKPWPYSILPSDYMASAARAAGIRVVLGGTLGDLVMFKGTDHRVAMLELLHAGHPLRFLQHCLEYGRFKEVPVTTVLAQLLPTYWPISWAETYTDRRLMSGQVKRTRAQSRDVAGAFGLTPDLVARARPRRLRLGTQTLEFPRVKRFIVSALYQAALHGVGANSAWAQGVHTTFPYLHRPLVEFVLGVPQLALWHPSIVRAGMKRALDGVLPPAILERRSKGLAEPAVTRSVRPLAAQMVTSARTWKLVTEGYVDSAALVDALNSVLDGSRNRGRFVKTCLELEAWLRTMTNRRQHVGVQMPPDYVAGLPTSVRHV